MLQRHGITPTSAAARVEGILRLRACIEALRTSRKRQTSRPRVAQVTRTAAALLKALGSGGELLVDMQLSGIPEPAELLRRLRADLAAMSKLRPGKAGGRGRGVDVLTVGYLGTFAEIYEQMTGKRASVSKSVGADGLTRWGSFVALATDCFARGGRNVTQAKLASAWERARQRQREHRKRAPLK